MVASSNDQDLETHVRLSRFMIERCRRMVESGKDVFVVDPAPRGLEDVQARGVTLVSTVDQLPSALHPAIVLLAVKPQFMDEALPAYRWFVRPGTVFLSIAAGKTVAYLKDRLGADAAVVRSMPNTPAAVGRGMVTTLLLGPTHLQPAESSLLCVARFQTAADLQRLLHEHWPGHDVLIMAAAVAE